MSSSKEVPPTRWTLWRRLGWTLGIAILFLAGVAEMSRRQAAAQLKSASDAVTRPVMDLVMDDAERYRRREALIADHQRDLAEKFPKEAGDIARQSITPQWLPYAIRDTLSDDLSPAAERRWLEAWGVVARENPGLGKRCKEYENARKRLPASKTAVLGFGTTAGLILLPVVGNALLIVVVRIGRRYSRYVSEAAG